MLDETEIKKNNIFLNPDNTEIKEEDSFLNPDNQDLLLDVEVKTEENEECEDQHLHQFSYTLDLSLCNTPNDKSVSFNNCGNVEHSLKYVKVNTDNTIDTNSEIPWTLAEKSISTSLKRIISDSGFKITAKKVRQKGTSFFRREHIKHSSFQNLNQDHSMIKSGSSPDISYSNFRKPCVTIFNSTVNPKTCEHSPHQTNQNSSAINAAIQNIDNDSLRKVNSDKIDELLGNTSYINESMKEKKRKLQDQGIVSGSMDVEDIILDLPKKAKNKKNRKENTEGEDINDSQLSDTISKENLGPRYKVDAMKVKLIDEYLAPHTIIKKQKKHQEQEIVLNNIDIEDNTFELPKKLKKKKIRKEKFESKDEKDNQLSYKIRKENLSAEYKDENVASHENRKKKKVEHQDQEIVSENMGIEDDISELPKKIKKKKIRKQNTETEDVNDNWISDNISKENMSAEYKVEAIMDANFINENLELHKIKKRREEYQDPEILLENIDKEDDTLELPTGVKKKIRKQKFEREDEKENQLNDKISKENLSAEYRVETIEANFMDENMASHKSMKKKKTSYRDQEIVLDIMGDDTLDSSKKLNKKKNRKRNVEGEDEKKSQPNDIINKKNLSTENTRGIEENCIDENMKPNKSMKKKERKQQDQEIVSEKMDIEDHTLDSPKILKKKKNRKQNTEEDENKNQSDNIIDKENLSSEDKIGGIIDENMESHKSMEEKGRKQQDLEIVSEIMDIEDHTSDSLKKLKKKKNRKRNTESEYEEKNQSNDIIDKENSSYENNDGGIQANFFNENMAPHKSIKKRNRNQEIVSENMDNEDATLDLSKKQKKKKSRKQNTDTEEERENRLSDKISEQHSRENLSSEYKVEANFINDMVPHEIMQKNERKLKHQEIVLENIDVQDDTSGLTKNVKKKTSRKQNIDSGDGKDNQPSDKLSKENRSAEYMLDAMEANFIDENIAHIKVMKKKRRKQQDQEVSLENLVKADDTLDSPKKVEKKNSWKQNTEREDEKGNQLSDKMSEENLSAEYKVEAIKENVIDKNLSSKVQEIVSEKVYIGSPKKLKKKKSRKHNTESVKKGKNGRNFFESNIKDPEKEVIEEKQDAQQNKAFKVNIPTDDKHKIQEAPEFGENKNRKNLESRNVDSTILKASMSSSIDGSFNETEHEQIEKRPDCTDSQTTSITQKLQFHNEEASFENENDLSSTSSRTSIGFTQNIEKMAKKCRKENNNDVLIKGNKSKKSTENKQYAVESSGKKNSEKSKNHRNLNDEPNSFNSPEKRKIKKHKYVTQEMGINAYNDVSKNEIVEESEDIFSDIFPKRENCSRSNSNDSIDVDGNLKIQMSDDNIQEDEPAISERINSKNEFSRGNWKREHISESDESLNQQNSYSNTKQDVAALPKRSNTKVAADLKNDSLNISFTFADILSQSHNDKLMQQVNNILAETSKQNTSSDTRCTDRELENFESNSYRELETTVKTSISPGTTKSKKKNLNKFEITIDHEKKEKKKAVCKLLEQSKSLGEIMEELEIIDIEEEKKRVEGLEIVVPWSTPLIHKIAYYIGQTPNARQKEELEAAGIQIKVGKYTREEDEQIKKNWRRFCKEHDWDVENYKPFTKCGKSGNSILNRRQIRQFVEYISRGFENRLMYHVYMRFQRLFSKSESIRFTPEDDKIIIEYIGQGSSKTPFADLSIILNRSRIALQKRYTLLKSLEKGEDQKLVWNKKLTEEFLAHLINATCSINLSELKNRQITPLEFEKVSKTMKIPVRKLRNSWRNVLYPRLFANNYREEKTLAMKKLVDLLYEKYTDWREIDWYEIAKSFGNSFTHLTLNRMLGSMLQTLKSPHIRSDFRRALKCLKKKLKNSKTITRDSKKFVKDILIETKNGTVLPKIDRIQEEESEGSDNQRIIEESENSDD